MKTATAELKLDAYVITTLMADLVEHDRSPAAFLVYLYLWAQCALSSREPASAEISLRNLAEGTGLSKRAVQTAVAHLKRRQLLASTQATPTSTPVYSVLKPWRRGG